MIDRVRRKPRRVTRDEEEPLAEAGTAERWHRKPQRQARRVRPRVPRVKMPPAKETGDPVRGYRGCRLYTGTHVKHAGEDSPGTITGLGPQQCVVKWARNGISQAEITEYLERY